jgi:DNA-binding SARP family transcriptional activator
LACSAWPGIHARGTPSENLHETGVSPSGQSGFPVVAAEAEQGSELEERPGHGPARSFCALQAEGAVHDAEVALRAGDLEATTGAALVANAISRRPFLEGIDRDWVHRQRAQLRDIQVRSLWCRAESAFARGDHSDAIGDAQRIIALEPFREQAYVILMRAQVDAGNNAETLATYERLRETLASELGASPSPTTEAAFIDVLRAT